MTKKITFGKTQFVFKIDKKIQMLNRSRYSADDIPQLKTFFKRITVNVVIPSCFQNLPRLLQSSRWQLSHNTSFKKAYHLMSMSMNQLGSWSKCDVDVRLTKMKLKNLIIFYSFKSYRCETKKLFNCVLFARIIPLSESNRTQFFLSIWRRYWHFTDSFGGKTDYQGSGTMHWRPQKFYILQRHHPNRVLYRHTAPKNPWLLRNLKTGDVEGWERKKCFEKNSWVCLKRGADQPSDDMEKLKVNCCWPR